MSYELKYNSASTGCEVFKDGELLGWLSKSGAEEIIPLLFNKLNNYSTLCFQTKPQKTEWKFWKDYKWGYSLRVISGELVLFNPWIKNTTKVLHYEQKCGNIDNPIEIGNSYIRLKEGFYNNLILDNGSKYLFNEGSGEKFYDSGKNQFHLSLSKY